MPSSTAFLRSHPQRAAAVAEWFDKENYNDSTLRCVEGRQNPGYRRPSGRPYSPPPSATLQPFEAGRQTLTRIKAQHDWNSEQLIWLDRLADSIKEGGAR